MTNVKWLLCSDVPQWHCLWADKNVIRSMAIVCELVGVKLETRCFFVVMFLATLHLFVWLMSEASWCVHSGVPKWYELT